MVFRSMSFVIPAALILASSAAAQNQRRAERWFTATSQPGRLDPRVLAKLDTGISGGQYGCVEGMPAIQKRKLVYEPSSEHDYDQLAAEPANESGPLNAQDHSGPDTDADDKFAAIVSDPPSLAIIDARAGKIVARVALAENPIDVVLGNVPGILYVLHEGGACRSSKWSGTEQARWKSPSSVSVVDWPAQQVIKNLPLSWNVDYISLSDDGRYLLAAGMGRGKKKRPGPDERAFVHWIDSATHEQVKRVSPGSMQTEFAASPDGSRVFALTANALAGDRSWWHWTPTIWGCDINVWPKPGSFALSVLDAGRADPVSTIALPGMPSQAFLSADSKWLYVLDSGRPDKNEKRNREAMVHVVDAVGGSLVSSHSAGTYPRGSRFDDRTGILTVLSNKSVRDHTGQLFRWRDGKPMETIELSNNPLRLLPKVTAPGTVAISETGACLMDEESQLERQCFDLKTIKMQYMEGTGHAGFEGFLPLDLKFVPSLSRVILRTGKNGDQIALVDIGSGKSDGGMAVGSAGMRRDRAAENAAKTAGLVASGAALLMLGGFNLNLPPSAPLAWWDVPMELRGDGKFAYIPNFYTNEITILDVESGKEVKGMPLAGRPQGLSIISAGTQLVAYSAKKAILLDTDRNEPIFEACPQGDIQDLRWTMDGKRLLAVTKDAVVLWDAGSPKPVASFRDLARVTRLQPLKRNTNSEARLH